MSIDKLFINGFCNKVIDKLRTENEDLSKTNTLLAKENRRLQKLLTYVPEADRLFDLEQTEKRVLTMENEYTKYYELCVELESVIDMMNNTASPQP